MKDPNCPKCKELEDLFKNCKDYYTRRAIALDLLNHKKKAHPPVKEAA